MSVAGRIATIAADEPGRPALTFLDFAGAGQVQRLSYGELWSRAERVASHLVAAGLDGRPVMLVHEPGLDFAVTLIGCLAAGAVAVPAPVPTFAAQRQRLEAIVRACQPAAVIACDAAVRVLDRLVGIELPAILHLDLQPEPAAWRPALNPDAVALLQHTSGSTGEPKVIAITQGNLAACVVAMEQAFDAPPGTRCLNWMPHTHDMGLIGGLVAPLAASCDTYLMSPTAFLQRPLRWVASVAEHRIEMSSGPDFAYALLADRVTDAEAASLDLSSWRIACVGAEPVREGTMTRFASRFAVSDFRSGSLMPAYGLAEATLFVTATQPGTGASFVRIDRTRLAAGEAHASETDGAATFARCGVPAAGTMVRILDAGSDTVLPLGHLGEIAVAGDQVAFRRWPDSESKSPEVAEVEGLRLLRTGDLGFLDAHGLVVVDRLKDVLVIRGRNHACHDLEASAAVEAPAALLGALAAIQAAGTGELVLLAELAGRAAPAPGALEEAFGRIRSALFRSHGLGLQALIVVRRNGLPRTTSGKLRRRAARDLLRDGELDVIAHLGLPMETAT